MARCTVEAEDSEVESSCSSINQSVSKKKITRPMPKKMPLRKMHRKENGKWSAVLPKFRTSCPRFKGPLARKRATIRAHGALRPNPTAWNKVATWTLNLTPSHQNMLFVQQTETWTLTVSQNNTRSIKHPWGTSKRQFPQHQLYWWDQNWTENISKFKVNSFGTNGFSIIDIVRGQWPRQA